MERVKWNGEWVRISNRFGKFLMFESELLNSRYAEGTYQPEISDLIESGNYDIFVDVGSYSGYFGIVAANYCKKVILYEASPFFFGLVLYNTKYLRNVDCQYAWVSNKGDIPWYSDYIDKEGQSLSMARLETKIEEKIGNEYNIKVVTLDNELKKFRNEKMFIKMDVEGNELKVLKGATELLKQPNIHWHIDVHTQDGIQKEQVASFFLNREIEYIGDKIMIIRGVVK